MLRQGLQVFALACLIALGAASARAGVVQICDGDGNCYIFHDVPSCSEWGLASTTTCVDLDLAMAVPLGSHRDPGRTISFAVDRGVVVANISRGRGAKPERVRLLNLRGVAKGDVLGVAVKVQAAAFNSPVAVRAGGSRYARTMLTVEVLRLDRRTRALLERRTWGFDITSPDALSPSGPVAAQMACPKGTYPPKCYPCLGCEPCNDGSGDYCDTTGGAMVAPDSYQPARARGYAPRRERWRDYQRR